MPDQGKLLEAIDRTRERHGFLTLAEMLALADSGNVIFDPFSTLIARDAVVGGNNVFHPNTRLDCRAAALRHDRKRVVWGKRVSVRVHLGVHRIIKKKKQK